ncbi:patatin-like phospholipase family protein [Oceanotoga sp. DSM 15011]|jgi:NTE family protein|uniref:NTE family protein n=1 Tax=Oceanotoga teriensis TaxID=515440 RepID=A0AA45C8Z8_9BACT|nr:MULTISPECIES: patatin-like phospholipase family protein [Oceanotoga]MDN5342093.1 hypothetical protein [Oceanotoga sp.]PWJ96275.1 NTE family protein [Oceanotoga teriensis]UYP00059.1 patatin-like phospholipase family protein [Oceanotoga sp. DSM 15011]
MKYGLALGSGGIRGLAHVALINLLKEKRNQKIDIISGCSAGAVIGALFALDPELDLYNKVEQVLKNNLSELNKITKSLNSKINMFTKIISTTGINTNDIIYNSLKEIFHNKKFSDCKIPFYAITFDLETGEEIIINEGFIIDAVMASANVPAAFYPLRIGGMLLVDGGSITPVPANVLKEEGADYIISCDISQPDFKEEYDNGIEYINTVDEFKIELINQREKAISDEYYIFDEQLSWEQFTQYDYVYKKAYEKFGSEIL